MSRDPVFNRLESTIASWTDEVTLAHDQLTGQIAEARDQLSILSGIMAKRQGESAALNKSRDDIARLQEAVRERDAQLRETRQRQQQLGHEKSRAERDASRLLEESRSIHAEKIELEKSLAEARGEADEAFERVAGLEEELADQEAIIAAGRLSSEADKARIAELLEQANALQDEVNALHERSVADAELAQELQQRLEAITGLKEELTGDLTRREDELAELNRLLSDREENLRCAQAALEDRESRISQLQLDYQALQTQHSEAVDANGLLADEKAQLDDRMRKLTREASDTRQDNERLVQRLADLRAELTANVALLSNTRTTLSALQSEHKALKVELNQFRTALDSTNRQSEIQRTELEKLEREYAQTATSLQDTKDALNAATDREKSVKQRLEERTKALEAAEYQARELQQKTQQQSTKIQGLEAQLDITAKSEALARSERENLESELRAKNHEFRTLEQQLDRSQVELSEVSSRAATTQSNVDALQFSLESLQAEHEQSLSRATTLGEQLSNFQRTLNDREQELYSERGNLWRATEEIVQLSDGVRRLEGLLAEAGASLTLTQEERDQARQTELGLRVEQEALQSEIARQQEQIEILRASNATQSANLEELGGALDTAQREHAAVAQKLSEATNTIAELTEKNNVAMSRIGCLDTEKSDLKTSLDTLTKEHAGLATQHVDLTRVQTETLATLELERAISREKYSELQQEHEVLQQSLDTILHEKESLEGQMSNLSLTLDEARASVSAHIRERDTVQLELNELREEFAHIRNQTKRETATLKSDLTAAQAQNAATHAALLEVREECASLSREVNEKQNSLDGARALASESESRATHLEAVLETSRRNERDRQAEAEKLSVELSEAQARTSEQDVQLLRFRTEVEALRESLRVHEAAARRDKERTTQMLQQAMSVLQSELRDHGQVSEPVGNVSVSTALEVDAEKDSSQEKTSVAEEPTLAYNGKGHHAGSGNGFRT